jgi:hypothetical protein
MTMDMDERFEADLRAAMAAEPVGNDLKRRIMERATPRARKSVGAGWLAALDPRNWRLPMLVEIGAVAAAASLAVGVFVGANNNVFGSSMATTTTVASADNTVDLVALAYDDSSDAGDPQ